MIYNLHSYFMHWSRPLLANMRHHGNVPSRRTPPPDVMRSLPNAPPTGACSPPRLRPQPHQDFLIIGLFALRLTKRLIEGLEHYTERDVDIAWLTNFLAPYPLEFALAKVSGPRRDDYIATYRDIVSRMKRQPRFPIRFMQMNPDQSVRRPQGHHRVEREDLRRMTDRE
jgi:hypothetical protein